MDSIKSIAVPVTRRTATKAKRAGRPAPAADARVGGSVGEFRRQPQPVTAQPTHQYRVGQHLAMARGSLQIARSAAGCVVVALVPYEAGGLRYRVRSDVESFERIVDEADLAPFGDQP